MNVLITGGCGFIASNFLNLTIKKYPHYTFVNIDCMDYCSNKSNIDSHDNYIFVKGKIQDSELITKILNQYQINVIIHFAAQTHVDRSFNHAMDCIDTNIIGTYNLLECCRHYGKLEKFIHVSTDEVYGDSSIIKDESSGLFPTNPYSASKAGAEMICYAYYKSFKIPLIITRGNNVYGPSQYCEKVIPKFIRLIQNGQKCTIHGTGNYLRSFLHVDDVANAFDIILHKGQIGEVYNIGIDVEISIIQVAKMCIKIITGSDNYNDYIVYTDDRLYNDKNYPINSDKLKSLGWEAKIPFETGLKSTIEWYSNIDIHSYWTTDVSL
jgi:UDP-glucose 4,6-dehydratase